MDLIITILPVVTKDLPISPRLQRQNIFMAFKRVPVKLSQQYNVAEKPTVILLYTPTVQRSPCRDTIFFFNKLKHCSPYHNQNQPKTMY